MNEEKKNTDELFILQKILNLDIGDSVKLDLAIVTRISEDLYKITYNAKGALCQLLQ